MRESNEFEVTIRRKIPFLSNLINILFLISILLATFLSAVIAPSNPNEMHSITYLSFLPKGTFGILTLLIIGSALFLYLYFRLRRYSPGILKFLPDTIDIKGDSIAISMRINSISEVYCIQPTDHDGNLKQKVIFYFQYNGRQIRAKLNDYLYVDQFMEQLLAYPNLNLQFYDFDFGVNADAEK